MVPTPHPFGFFSLSVGGESLYGCMAASYSGTVSFLTQRRDALPSPAASSLGVCCPKQTQHTIWSELKVQDPTFLPQTSGPGGGMQEDRPSAWAQCAGPKPAIYSSIKTVHVGHWSAAGHFDFFR